MHKQVLLITLFLLGYLVTGALLYRAYRLKRRGRLIIEQQQEDICHKEMRLQQFIHSHHQLLKEKEWLVKEVHHRVKNNLQMMISLLNTQSVYLEDRKALEAISQSQHRMYVMSLVHQQLYLSDHLSLINMNLYIRQLVNYCKDNLAASQNITFEVDFDKVQLDISQAIPIGLILHEAISHSMVQAFPDHQQGLVTISLKYTGDDLVLEVANNGSGIAPGSDLFTPGTMGMNLIRILSEQLDGHLEMDGTKLTVCINRS